MLQCIRKPSSPQSAPLCYPAVRALSLCVSAGTEPRATRCVRQLPKSPIKKRCPGRGGAGLQETFLSGLDRRSQSTHAGLQGPYTEARLCPEVEPRELSADHLQLVLRASFVEPVDQRD